MTEESGWGPYKNEKDWLRAAMHKAEANFKIAYDRAEEAERERDRFAKTLTGLANGVIRDGCGRTDSTPLNVQWVIDNVVALRVRAENAEATVAAMRAVINDECLNQAQFGDTWVKGCEALDAGDSGWNDVSPAPDLDTTDPGPMAVLHIDSDEVLP